MKKLINTVLVFALCGVTFAASSTAKVKTTANTSTQKDVPDWVTGKSSEYPEKFYLIGTGSGYDQSSAQENAKANLVKTLSQNLEVIEKVKSYADNTTDFSIYTQNINTSSDIKSITGLKIADTYTSENKVYVLAVLERQDAADYYSTIIIKNDKAISEYMSEAKKISGTITSCIYAQKAVKLAKENEYYSNLIDVIDPVFPVDIALSYKSLINLEQQVAKFKQDVQISIIVENDSKNIVKNAFHDCFDKIGIPVLKSDSAKYVVKASVTLEKADSPDKKHVFYNYGITADLIVSATNKALLNYSNYSRAGHINDQGAKNKVFLQAAKDVKTSFYQELVEHISAE